MESQHMTQQIFAQFIKISPATLSGIFNGRTNPSLNIVEAVKQSLPSISTDWLLFGRGPMYVEDVQSDAAANGDVHEPAAREQTLDFSVSPAAPSAPAAIQSGHQNVLNPTGNKEKQGAKIFDKINRKITEIRIFYDDQTWETFVPKNHSV